MEIDLQLMCRVRGSVVGTVRLWTPLRLCWQKADEVFLRNVIYVLWQHVFYAKYWSEQTRLHGENWSRMTTVLPSQLTFFTTGRRGVLARACARTSDGRAQIHALRRVLEPPFTSYDRERIAGDADEDAAEAQQNNIITSP